MFQLLIRKKKKNNLLTRASFDFFNVFMRLEFFLKKQKINRKQNGG
jgi:hypothetical protein